MPSLADRADDEFTKLIYIGDSSTGKTGSLVSLVEAGYKVRMLDMDDGIGMLRAYVKKQCPDKLSAIDYVSFRDKFKIKQSGAYGVDGSPKAFAAAMNALTKWDDGSVPSEWGKDTFLVLDTLNTLGKSALLFAEGLDPSNKDPRRWFQTGQTAIEHAVAMIMGPDFKTNVIIISHISERELADGTKKGFPASGVGTALGPTLAKYCNTLVLAETVGFGEKARRRIKTTPTGYVDLKTAAPFAMAAEYPIETGLATIVETLKAN